MPRPPSDKTKPRKSRATGKAKADPERNDDGTVASGNKTAKGKGRGGRQTLAEETRYMNAIRKGLSPAKLTKVVDAVVAEALQGNIKAAELLMKYVVGKPTEYRAPDADKPTAIEITYVRATPPKDGD